MSFFSWFKSAGVWIGVHLLHVFTSDTAKKVAMAGVAVLKEEVGKLALVAVQNAEQLSGLDGPAKKAAAMAALSAALGAAGDSIPKRELSLAVEFAVGAINGDFGAK